MFRIKIQRKPLRFRRRDTSIIVMFVTVDKPTDFKMLEESVYYVRGKTICCYDFGSGKRRAVGGRQMRKELADIVAGKGGGCTYVG